MALYVLKAFFDGLTFGLGCFRVDLYSDDVLRFTLTGICISDPPFCPFLAHFSLLFGYKIHHCHINHVLCVVVVSVVVDLWGYGALLPYKFSFFSNLHLKLISNVCTWTYIRVGLYSDLILR